MAKEISYNLADTVQMKKPHACQTNDWEILRMGADIKLKCMGCGHMVMMPRSEFNRKGPRNKLPQNQQHKLTLG